MSLPSSIRLAVDSAPAAFWSGLAEAVARWCAQQDAALRDTVVLLPFAQLLDPARRAFAARGSWQPRIETSETWAASLGPAPEPEPGLLSGVPALDLLSAAQLLRGTAGLADWERRDPRAFQQAVSVLVATAEDLHRAAHTRPPAERPAFWLDALEAAGSAGSPHTGALERSLARLAVEWARLAPAPASDRLFAARPAALVWLDAGGRDDLAAALAAAGDAPALQLIADPPEAEITQALAAGPPARLIVVDGFAAEAGAVAAEVLGHLAAGRRPVALVALDRSLMRRVRALLERRAIAIADETGWALSTTRAAAHLMALLDAAAPRARHDDWLLALKAWPADAAPPRALQQLERCWRAGQALGDSPAAALLAQAQAWLAPLGEPGRRPLAEWLRRLRQVLDLTGLTAALAADDAGRQLLDALPSADGAGGALAAALDGESLDAAGFRAWVDRTLERASYRPPPVARPDVVLTPLGRAILRPFAAAVIGAADENHLLAMTRHEGLLPEAAARALGLATPRIAWERERLALVQLLRLAPLSVVRRRVDGDEPRAASLALDAIELARRRAALSPWRSVDAPLVAMSIAPEPVSRPAPSAAEALPARLSASTLEALRACPYRFFARSVLRLREAEELAAAVEKRDYGNWLHDVLDRFHRARTGASDDAAALTAAAEQVTAESSLEAERLLPFRIGFEWFAPAYLAWLHEREARGLHWNEGEVERTREPAEIPGLQLHGRIDRIDRSDGDGRIELIDYKTGSATRLTAQVKQPLEDTQLAFYALLMAADRDTAADFRALYLALDDRQAPKEIVHEAVADTARSMLQGLAADWQRLRAGAGLPALGEGAVCETCEARGLCRRDHWVDVA